MMENLPGIKKIGVIGVANVPANVVYKAMSGILTILSVSPTYLCSVRNAKWSLEVVRDCRARTQKVKLTFSVNEKIENPQDLAFVVVTVEGQAYLVGAKEKPYPVVTCKKSTGEPGSESAAWSYEVSFSAYRAMIPVMLT